MGLEVMNTGVWRIGCYQWETVIASITTNNNKVIAAISICVQSHTVKE